MAIDVALDTLLQSFKFTVAVGVVFASNAVASAWRSSRAQFGVLQRQRRDGQAQGPRQQPALAAPVWVTRFLLWTSRSPCPRP